MNFSFSPMSAICGAHFILDLITRYYYASSTNHEAPHYAIFSVLPLLPHTLPHIRQLADGISPQRLKFDPTPTHVGCGVQSGTGTRFLYKPFGLPLSLSFHPGFIPISIYLRSQHHVLEHTQSLFSHLQYVYLEGIFLHYTRLFVAVRKLLLSVLINNAQRLKYNVTLHFVPGIVNNIEKCGK